MASDRVDRFFLMTRHKAPLWPFGLKLNRECVGFARTRSPITHPLPSTMCRERLYRVTLAHRYHAPFMENHRNFIHPRNRFMISRFSFLLINVRGERCIVQKTKKTILTTKKGKSDAQKVTVL